MVRRASAPSSARAASPRGSSMRRCPPSSRRRSSRGPGWRPVGAWRRCAGPIPPAPPRACATSSCAAGTPGRSSRRSFARPRGSPRRTDRSTMSPPMTGSAIREKFLAYFERNGHARVRSSPLVPGTDPTLLFTNAGMVQFKAVFLGEERRDSVRATTCQKCVRAGGKHNDLENVGRTARHHTFFEMLGNFSFGDYFKAEAIAFAWEFLTRDLGLDRRRLAATVFTDDDDAFGLWKKVAGFTDDRVLRLGEEDNFWAMGDTGPCGPCSEVHFHQGDHLPCPEEAAGRSCLGPACECDRWLEIWNLVFMQFNRDASGVMRPLPRPSIDTGMGLERVAAVMQGKTSDYDTDLFAPLIERIAALSGKDYRARQAHDVSMQVIADHARATTFLIADGVTPSNEWRGYVLRRIMRRAMRHGRLLGLTEPFLWRTVDWVVGLMRDTYPELETERRRVEETVRAEEERFAETLDTGMRLIEEYDAGHRRPGSRGVTTPLVLDGRFLFRLYDTYGFPRDLAEEIFRDKGWIATEETEATYEAEMEAQRARARAGAAFGTDEGTEAAAIYQRLAAEIPRVEFVGYDTLTAPARIMAIVDAGGGGMRRVREAAEGAEVEMILDRTPAYAESGGQVGDTGTIAGRAGRGQLLDTYYRGSKLIVHRVRVVQGGFHENEEVAVSVETPRRQGLRQHHTGTHLLHSALHTHRDLLVLVEAALSVETPRRQGLRQHHTGTHLLHSALRRILGPHVAQAGSLVAPDHLRFDFSHGAQVKDREIEQVEELVNEHVQANTPVTNAEMDLDAALAAGAMALFGEKYGDRVR